MAPTHLKRQTLNMPTVSISQSEDYAEGASYPELKAVKIKKKYKKISRDSKYYYNLLHPIDGYQSASGSDHIIKNRNPPVSNSVFKQ